MAPRTFIVAEAGVNHNGNILTAKKMIDVAAAAGADAIKFQTFKAESVVSKYAPKAEYQKKSTSPRGSQLNMIKRLELDRNAHKALMKHAKRRKIEFISTPFDLKSIDLLHSLGIKIFKIPSGEITNMPYLRKIGSLKKKIILSTGMSTLKEIREALDILLKSGTKKENVTILQCNTEYPTRPEDVNLRSMLTMKKELKTEVGYSDHTLGIEVPVAACALGAKVIEKHFTLNRRMKGPDHKSSIEPYELKHMVEALRNAEKSLGSSQKKPSQSEIKNKNIIRKSIIASHNIRKGELFSKQNITVKRPGTGLSPMKWDNVLGKKAKRNFEIDELIEL